jgi:endoglucanase
MGRGGLTIEFYLIPLLPLLALNVGLVLGSTADWLKRFLESRSSGAALVVRRGVPLVALGLCLALITPGYSSSNLGFEANPYSAWTNTQTDGQKQVTTWIRGNLSNESKIIIDSSMWTDLHDPPNGAVGFEGAHYYWKVALDPEIRDDVFNNDWRKADYITSDATVRQHERDANLSLVGAVLDNATPVMNFDTGGWPVEIRRVNKLQQWSAPDNPILSKTWAGYKERFVEDGRVVDPRADRQTTTSEGQSYALLRAVYMDDRQAFDEVWGWTERNLQVREDGLLAWEYEGRPDEASGVTDESSATDADTDAALALLFAAQRWDTPEYEQEALEILRGIWEQETTAVGGARVVTAGSWARGDDWGPVVVNPSYFAPYAYRIFAEADPNHDWMDLVDSSYGILERVRASSELGGEAGLAPNWLALDKDTGELLSANGLVEGQADEFSYDASRLPWRLSLDWFWFKENRAREVLEGLSLPRRELEQQDRLLASYNPDGSPAADHDAISVYAGVLPGLLFGGDQAMAHKVFTERILGEYTDDPEGSYWGEDPDGYYDQNMAWFATAVMDGAMSNLWEGEEVIDWDRIFQSEPEQAEPEK